MYVIALFYAIGEGMGAVVSAVASSLFSFIGGDFSQAVVTKFGGQVPKCEPEVARAATVAYLCPNQTDYSRRSGIFASDLFFE